MSDRKSKEVVEVVANGLGTVRVDRRSGTKSILDSEERVCLVNFKGFD